MAPAQAKKQNTQECRKLVLRTSGLLPAIAYAVDVTPSGSHFHSWRVGLVAEHVAALTDNEARRDVFLAGLLHDIGAVGASKHITYYRTIRQQLEDVHVRNHAQRSAALVRWLPGMEAASMYIADHHEWYDGQGYPEGKSGDKILLGSQIIQMADILDTAGCFKSALNLRNILPDLSSLTGRAWPKELWSTFVSSLSEQGFYSNLFEPEKLAQMIAEKIEEVGIPEQLNNEEGVARALHIFAVLVDLKDPSTAGHSLRTARRAKTLATHMRLCPELAHTAYQAGLVHDCGRLGVDSSLLNKSGRLTEKEMEVVRKHAEMTIRIFSCLPNCTDMQELGRIAGHDHERWDGKGYPDGLSKEDIPLVSRILSVADAYDSMVASIEYRLLTTKGALLRLQQNAGSQFDPRVVEAMVEVVNSGQLDEDIKNAA